MGMAMPTDHGHGYAYGPWAWPCLRTMAMPRDPRPSPKLCRREREKDWPASKSKKTEPFYLTPWATSPDLRKAGPFSWKLPKRQYIKDIYQEKHVAARQAKKLKATNTQIKGILWKSIRNTRKRKKTIENHQKAKESIQFKGKPRNPMKSENTTRNLKKNK